MADTSLSAVVRHLRQIASPASDPRDDRELLAAFAVRQEQAAFAMLVRRHGPMVLNVCRRVLQHEQDAEDAFQATFLVLAAKAASVSIRTSVAGFLHGVAYRLALKARRETMRRRRREACAPISAASDAAAELSWREVQAVVEEEMQRLPDKYRLPFVLCHLQGLSRAEVGRQLGLKEGTVWSRLAQARARLKQRLERRGIALAAVLGALAVSESPVRASLIEGLVMAARSSAAGAVSANVAALTQAGLQTMTGKMKLALTGLVMLLAAGAGGVGYQALTAQAPETPAATTPQARAAPEPKKPEAPRVRTDRHGDPLPEGAIARLGTVRWRHGFLVHGLAYSPDGKMIAAVGAGRAVTLWDAATGKEIHRFPDLREQPGCLAFSPDGKLLATGGLHSFCRLWDVATGKEVRQIGAGRFAFAPDGKLVTTARYDSKAQTWDAESARILDANTGKELRRLECKQEDLSAVAYSRDGKILATGGKQGTILLWDAATGKKQHQFTGHTTEVWKIVFSSDGKRLASASNDGTIRLWQLGQDRPARILAEKSSEYDAKPIAFSPDGSLLAAGDANGTIHLWDVGNGAEIRHWQAGAMRVGAIAFSPDGKTLASGAAWQSIRLWDVATGRERHPSEEHLGFIDVVRFSSDGTGLISIGRDRHMLWWNLATQTPRRHLSLPTEGIHSVSFSADGGTFATSYWSTNKIRLWDTHTGKPVRLLGEAKKRVLALALSPDGRFVAAGVAEDGIHIWDARDGKEVQHIKDFWSQMMSLCFSPDSKALACSIWKQGTRTLRLWEVDSGKEPVTFPCFDVFTGPLAFSPDGKVLAAGSNNSNATGASSVHLWNTATGKAGIVHTGHGELVGAIAFSGDGKLVASGTGSVGYLDNSVHVWEAATGRLLRRFEGHHSCVSSVAFSLDGLTVASGGGDSTILLWDITGRRPDGRWHVKPLAPRQLDACWTALADEDATKAYDAVWRLVAAPE